MSTLRPQQTPTSTQRKISDILALLPLPLYISAEKNLAAAWSMQKMPDTFINFRPVNWNSWSSHREKKEECTPHISVYKWLTLAHTWQALFNRRGTLVLGNWANARARDLHVSVNKPRQKKGETRIKRGIMNALARRMCMEMTFGFSRVSEMEGEWEKWRREYSVTKLNGVYRLLRRWVSKVCFRISALKRC